MTEDSRPKTPSELLIKSEEVMADIRSAAWLEQELHPELDRHRRHQMADICEEGNVERVWRVLAHAVAELRVALRKALRDDTELRAVNDLDRPECWTFTFIYMPPPDTAAYIREKIHEYLVASVMADRAEVIIPACAGIWRERAGAALAALTALLFTLRQTGSALSPVRRPLCPF